jgi:predicted alpha-1,2-mannosidase
MMYLRFRAILLSTLVAVASAHAGDTTPDITSLVNPFIGTAGGGNVFPGATLPFGMVQFSPEASPFRPKSMIAAPGGYEYRAGKIRGFSLTNVEGWGCAGGSGDIPIMPITTAVKESPSEDFRNAYAAGFSHAQEEAHPGYYHVVLDNGVDVSLTASMRTGAALFGFPVRSAKTLLIRTSDSEVGSSDAHTEVDVKSGIVSGSVTSGNFCGYIDTVDRRSYYTLYFVATFDQKILQSGVWHDTTLVPGGNESSGGTGYGSKGFPDKGYGSGAWVSFNPSDMHPLHMRIGISYVSARNARANLQAEDPPGTSFEKLRAKAESAWENRLRQIQITGGALDQRTIFSTALYHALMTPTTASDVNGEYRGMDRKVHLVSGTQRVQYADFSGWDVYRSQFQLVTWLDPSIGSDIAQSLFNQAEQNGGAWDRWTHNSGATHVMNGDPAAAAISDIWAFGGHAFDAGAALESLVHAAEVPSVDDLSTAGCPVECVGERPGLDQWLKLHYIPAGAPAWGPAADTLEDATDDFSISVLAHRLGKEAIAGRFAHRAQYWRNIWNPGATPRGGYFENRNAEGTWALVQDDGDKAPHAFTPSTGDGFVEGTAAQYVWMVPFNVRGLFDAMGGNQKAAARLNAFFYSKNGQPAVTNAGPLHAELNNEPSVETPWLYDFAGQPWKTQQLVRYVLTRVWKNAPDGIPGNDDLGEMSSWTVFASMGLYPEIPGRAELVLASPLFPRIVIHRSGGDIVIRAPGASVDQQYITGLKVNGKRQTKSWLPESFALHGGTLDFDLSKAPDKNWGANMKDVPPSFNGK